MPARRRPVRAKTLNRVTGLAASAVVMIVAVKTSVHNIVLRKRM
jgi:hypothetical protein